jgi:hypothetical protein
LEKKDDGVDIVYMVDDEQKRTSVSGNYSDIVEIEERKNPRKIVIEFNEQTQEFVIKHDNVHARTKFSVMVDTAKNEIGVKTSTGEHYIWMLPEDVYDLLSKNGLIDKVGEGGMELLEGESGDLYYQVDGKKEIKILNLVDFSFDVNTQVSALSGEVIKVDQPKWYSAFEFIFN